MPRKHGLASQLIHLNLLILGNGAYNVSPYDFDGYDLNRDDYIRWSKVKQMPNCPKCGEEIEEEMTFCPKCGAPLKAPQAAVQPARTVTYRHEKEEKEEKREKGEKGEKYEKREQAFIGPLIGGLVLILIGIVAYLQIAGYIESRMMGAFFLVVIGLAIIFGALYGAVLASRRHPRT
jgi:hypothetical protein